MRNLQAFLVVLSLWGCSSPARTTADSHLGGKANPGESLVAEILNEHGFLPPVSLRGESGVAWMVSARPVEGKGTCIDRIAVRTGPAGEPPTVELHRFVRGPSDWAQVGFLLDGDRADEEGRIRQEIVSQVNLTR